MWLLICLAAEGPLTYQLLMWVPYATHGLVLWALCSGPGYLDGGTYVRWRSVELNKTSSHMWVSWYLPMFPLRDESLTPMNIASLMVLAMVCDSLPIMKKLFNLV